MVQASQQQQQQQQQQHVGFIGGGNMAYAIISGLLLATDNTTDAANSNSIKPFIHVFEPNADRAAFLRKQLMHTGCFATHASGQDVVLAASHAIVMAVKPQIMQQVTAGLKPDMIKKAREQGGRAPLLISIAAGIPVKAFLSWLEEEGVTTPVVRVMPNTPALLRAGATGMYSPANGMPGACNADERSLASHVMASVSAPAALYWAPQESQLDAVTAVSGSGPAYIFLLIEAMRDAGVDLGLPAEAAQALAAQTVKGAAEMCIANAAEGPVLLRSQVTSKGGTTAAAIARFEEAGRLRALVREAMGAAVQRAEEMAVAFTPVTTKAKH